MANRLQALSACAALALAMGAVSTSPAAAEMVYRMATMGEPKSLDPHLVSGTWENYIVGDAFLGLLTDAADASAIPERPRAGRSATTASPTPSACATTNGRTAGR